jgi:chromosome partitioning protein
LSDLDEAVNSASTTGFPAKRIAVAQRKGGVGKTTLAVSLAAESSQRGATTVLVDADPLRSARVWGELGRLTFPVEEIAFSSSSSVTGWASSVRRVQADFIIIDTPPSDTAMAASLSLADVAVIPCLPSGLDLEATARSLDIVHAIRARRANRLHVILVPNRVDIRTLEGRQLVEEMERFDERIAAPIGSRTAFVRSFSIGYSVSQYDPKGLAAAEIRLLWNLILQIADRHEATGRV